MRLLSLKLTTQQSTHTSRTWYLLYTTYCVCVCGGYMHSETEGPFNHCSDGLLLVCWMRFYFFFVQHPEGLQRSFNLDSLINRAQMFHLLFLIDLSHTHRSPLESKLNLIQFGLIFVYSIWTGSLETIGFPLPQDWRRTGGVCTTDSWFRIGISG